MERQIMVKTTGLFGEKAILGRLRRGTRWPVLVFAGLLIVACQQNSADLAQGPGAAQPAAVAPGVHTAAVVHGHGAASVASGEERTDDAQEEPQGLVLKLVDGMGETEAKSGESTQAGVPAQPMPAVPLDAEAAQALLARAPELTIEPTEALDFRFPTTTQSPPRAGSDRQLTFPPESETRPPDAAALEPLAILRFQPEGEITMASQLSVTFSQPMVPLAAIDDLAVSSGAVPVRLTPQPAGSWRWLGTRTLVFEPETRFAYSTHYRVEVPSGTKSALGSALPESAHWRFSTATASVQSFDPGGEALPLEPLITLAFNQPVDPMDVLEHAHVAVKSMVFFENEQALRLATAEERAADVTALQLIERLGSERVVTLRTVEPLPKDSRISAQLTEGITGTEGQRQSEHTWYHNYKTYSPLEVVRHSGGGDDVARPYGSQFID
ncbi:MAG: hypothetical protein ACI9EF_002885, partial [Pseudohongiellaceae bacterium]